MNPNLLFFPFLLLVLFLVLFLALALVLILVLILACPFPLLSPLFLLHFSLFFPAQEISGGWEIHLRF